MTDPLQHLRNFLAQNSFKALYEMYGIAARPCKDNSKWSLNYDQIASKPGCRIAEVCRGIVIRPITTVTDENQVVGPFHIVARGMDRFYNAGESHAAEIDWNTARIQEKLDGTMIMLYFDHVKQEWCVATRSVPEADVSFGDPPGSPLPENTFYELFKYTIEQRTKVNGDRYSFDEFFQVSDKRFTYVFELCTPLNRVVVKYPEYKAVLLCVRCNQTGRYRQDCEVKAWANLSTLEETLDFVNRVDPAQLEGAVIVDANWNRIKVKNKAWVLASRAKDCVTMSKRNALECIINGQIDDVIPLLDTHVAEYIQKLQRNLRLYLISVDASLSSFKDICETRKDFALAVQKSGIWQTPMFALYASNHANCLDWLRALSKNGKLTPTMLDTILQEIDKE